MKTIFISAGHSDPDPGAISPDKTYREEELAQRLRNKIAGNLRELGVPVLTDGADGENKPLRDAVATAKRNDGLSLELHFNAGPPGAAGIEALAHPELKILSQLLCMAISKHTKSPLRGQQGWKSPSSGQHHRLGFCDAGGIVLEICFISNPADLEAYLKVENEVAASLADVLAATSIEVKE